MWDFPERRLTLVTGPAKEPLDVVEVKTHCKIDVDFEDDLLESLIAAARGHVERVTGRQLITATWRLKLSHFPCGDTPIEIPVTPLLSVVSVKYRDTADVLQTWNASDYTVDAPAGPHATAGRVYPKFDKDYPAALDRPDAVEVEFTAGYGPNPENVPQELRHALFLLVGHWFENRESVNVGNLPTELPFAAQVLLDSFTRLTPLIR